MGTVERNIKRGDVYVTFSNVVSVAGDDTEVGVMLTMADYSSKDEFETAARKALGEKLGYELKYLRYTFEAADIHPSVWVNLGEKASLPDLSVDDAELVHAYNKAFEIEATTNQDDMRATLTHIQENGVFFGYYHTASKMAEQYLSNFEDSEGILDLVQPYVNLEGVATRILDEDIAEADNYYFNK